MTRDFTRIAPLFVFGAVLAGAGSIALAATPGPVGTLQRGPYACELPGDADGPVGLTQPDAGFSVQSASRYSAPQGSGVYLRRGNTVQMTSGPRRGESYAIVSDGFMRRVENGRSGKLRCVLAKN